MSYYDVNDAYADEMYAQDREEERIAAQIQAWMEDTDPATVIKVWEQITKGDEFDILNNVSVVLLRKGDAHKMLFDAIFDTFMKEPEEWYALS